MPGLRTFRPRSWFAVSLEKSCARRPSATGSAETNTGSISAPSRPGCPSRTDAGNVDSKAGQRTGGLTSLPGSVDAEGPMIDAVSMARLKTVHPSLDALVCRLAADFEAAAPIAGDGLIVAQ